MITVRCAVLGCLWAVGSCTATVEQERDSREEVTLKASGSFCAPVQRGERPCRKLRANDLGECRLFEEDVDGTTFKTCYFVSSECHSHVQVFGPETNPRFEFYCSRKNSALCEKWPADTPKDKPGLCLPVKKGRNPGGQDR